MYYPTQLLDFRNCHVRGCLQIMSADEGRKVCKMLTMADKGGRWDLQNAENGGQRGRGANANIG